MASKFSGRRRGRQNSCTSHTISNVEAPVIRFMQLTGSLNRMKDRYELDSMEGDMRSACIRIKGAASAVRDAVDATESFIAEKIVAQTWPPLDECLPSALKKPENFNEITKRLRAAHLIVTWSFTGNTITTYACSADAGDSGYRIIMDVINPLANAGYHATPAMRRHYLSQSYHSQSQYGSASNPSEGQQISELQFSVMMYLQHSGFLKDLKEQLGLDDVKLDMKTKSIYVTGDETKERQAVSEIKRKIGSLFKSTSKPISKPLLEILNKSKEVKEEITQIFKNKGFVAPWEWNGNAVNVCSDSQSSADEGIKVIEANLCESNMALSDEEVMYVNKCSIIAAFNKDFAPNQKAVMGEHCLTIYSSRLGKDHALQNMKIRIEKAKPRATKEMSRKGELLYIHRYCQSEIISAMNRTHARIEEKGNVSILSGSVDAVNSLDRELTKISTDIQRADLSFDVDDPILHYVKHHSKAVKNSLEIPTKTVLQVLPFGSGAKSGSNAGVSSVNGGENWLVLNNVKLTVELGDITNFKADGVVNTIGNSRNLASGTLGPTFLRKAGAVLQHELLRALPITAGLYRTNGYSFARYIYHCVVHTKDQPSESYKALGNYVAKILQEATSSGLTSLALPMLGTGNTSLQQTEVIRIIIESYLTFTTTSTLSQPLRNIYIVVLPQQSAMYTAFCEALKPYTSLFASSPLQSPRSSGGSVPCFRVFYKDQRNLKDLKLKLEQLRQEQVRDIVWLDVYPDSSRLLSQLTMDEVSRMKQAAQSRSVTMNVITSSEVVTNLVLKGLTDDVKELERLFTSWFRPEKDKFPSTWTPPLTSYSEPVLERNSREFLEVCQSFFNSLGRIAEIYWIKRVQNPHQHKLFTAEQEEVAAKLGKSCEAVSRSSLWHGAASDAVQKISRNSFNRSFAGAHGTAYGHGSYFSVNAQYSDRYSKVDLSGWKYIIRAKIVVGEYTLGNSSMKTAPYIGSPSSANHYNTTVDNTSSPSIYVTYTDAAAYPEYILSYR